MANCNNSSLPASTDSASGIGEIDQTKVAENVAAVTFHFQGKKWPRATGTTNPYEFFQGFPGFWSYCALAGVAFARQEECDDEWIAALGAYCDLVFNVTCAVRRLLTDSELEFLAKLAIMESQLKEGFFNVADIEFAPSDDVTKPLARRFASILNEQRSLHRLSVTRSE